MKHLLKIITILLITSCNNNNTFQITGETDRVGDAILLRINKEQESIHDTTSIKNGNFQFKKNLQEEELFRLRFHDGSFINLAANKGENIKIDFKEDKLSIQGSPGSIKMLEISEALVQLKSFEDSINRELQNHRQSPDFAIKFDDAKNQYFQKLEEHKRFLKNFIQENQTSKIALIALQQRNTPSSMILNIEEDLDSYETVLKNLKIHFPQSPYVDILDTEIKKAKNNPLAYGKPAPNFTLNDLNNKPFSLSDLKGKVVLIDFWASWCMPCRRANPKLVNLHNTYSDQGFEILSVSLDGNQTQKNARQSWLDAIRKDEIEKFIHVSELKGWETKVRALYNFNSIPHTVLIDRDGIIIGKNLNGPKLEIKIQNAINNESKK